jgi:hypothetical protein
MEDYEQGTIVRNYLNYNNASINNALGYMPFIDESQCDTKIPKLSQVQVSWRVASYGKRVHKGTGGAGAVTIREVNHSETMTMLEHINRQWTMEKIDRIIHPDFVRTFIRMKDSSTIQTTYIIKCIPVTTFRDLGTCLKEAMINHEIYTINTATQITAQSPPIVGRIYKCAPVWDTHKHRWIYIIIMDKVSGYTLEELNSLWFKLKHWSLKFKPAYDKHKLYEGLFQTISTLWWLGYVHNDLHPRNIIVNTETYHVTLVDLETCVVVPFGEVYNHRVQLGQNIRPMDSFKKQVKLTIDSYKQHLKFPAMSLLNISKRFIHDFSDDNDLLYNTDEHVLEFVDKKM